MIILAIILFIVVLLFSLVIYYFCKRLIYKLNKRVLARNLAVIKNGKYLSDYDKLDDTSVKEHLIIPFFLVLGYNTFDFREFVRSNKKASFIADYVTKKWHNGKLCKNSLYIKYEKFSDAAVDLKNKTYTDNKLVGASIDELMNKLYFDGEYYVLTNGYLYLFFNKNYKIGSKKFDFCFNLKNYSKSDVAKLAHFTKQCMFLDLSDVYLAG